eukprot:2688951-Pyramimonas_sp.AAC.1
MGKSDPLEHGFLGVAGDRTQARKMLLPHRVRRSGGPQWARTKKPLQRRVTLTRSRPSPRSLSD